MATEVKSKCYTCLDPIAMLNVMVAKVLILITEVMLIDDTRSSITQTIGDNIHEANKVTIRTIHQSIKRFRN